MTTREIFETVTREEGIALFNEKKTDKEVYDILVKKGLTDSFETFISEAQNIFAEKVSEMGRDEILAQIEGAELSDEQLEMIAGGGKNDSNDLGAILGGTLGGSFAAGFIAVVAWSLW